MIELSIRKPVAVTVAVLLILLFGFISLTSVPIQLTPNISKPEITVETRWLGASPHEIEREIVDEQEEQLKGVEGVDRITSESQDSLGRIILEFPAGTDMDAALIKVSNRLEQVPDYPDDADKPVILTSNRNENAMAWFMLHRLAGNETDMDRYFRLAEDLIKPRLERVAGVSSANVYGGRDFELQINVDPERLAARGITMTALMLAIDRENTNVSGGDFNEGKRSYKVRTVGEYVRPEDVEKVVLETRDGKRVYLRDVAEVRVGLKKRESFVRQRGVETIAVNCLRSVGANVLETMAGVRSALRELNEEVLATRGLKLVQVYDETEYIDESIQRVYTNLLIGSGLAIAVLFLFLRHVRSTLIIAVAIPVSIIGSFILMNLFGRSINVISLAGMSFAAGMVVDNAIVSLENIFRLRQAGRTAFEAAREGASEVWGAILASTLTTIAVFLPILFVEERVGQLFRDIALAISCSVGLSLLVSITVIPALAAKLMAGSHAEDKGVGRLFGGFRSVVTGIVGAVIGRTWTRVATVVSLTTLSCVLAFVFLPETEYLPEGNRNLAIGILLPPPGYSLPELEKVGSQIETKLAGALAPDEELPNGAAEAAAAPERNDAPPANTGVRIKHFFFVARGSAVFMGASATDPERAGQLVPLMQGAVADVPGFISVVQQASLFERGIATGRSVDIEITGPDLERLIAIGGRIFGAVSQRFPRNEGHQARPIPSLDLQTPEVHVVPDRERAKDLGLDARELGVTVNAIIDGVKASEYQFEGREVDLTVMAGERDRVWRTQDLQDVQIQTPGGKLVSLGSVAAIDVTGGPQQINHIERNRAITIQVVPSKDMPLETAVRIIRDEVVTPIREQGALGGGYSITLAGTVDDLYQAFKAFRWNFLLAVIITYLLMAALFESFLYPFIVLFSVPLAAVGGVVCLDLVHAFAPDVRLDILTMLGFVILVGVVVNNAILIVYKSLQELRGGAPYRDAIRTAVHSRIRPIFMTTFTSGFGLLPLVVFPGAGSELYRGLGSVVVGGLVVSTVFTLLLIPALLGIVFALQERFGGTVKEASS